MEKAFVFRLLAVTLADKFIYPAAEAFLTGIKNLTLQDSSTD